jgi:hypothetical protein
MPCDGTGAKLQKDIGCKYAKQEPVLAACVRIYITAASRIILHKHNYKIQIFSSVSSHWWEKEDLLQGSGANGFFPHDEKVQHFLI